MHVNIMIPEKFKRLWDKATWHEITIFSNAIEAVTKNYIRNCKEEGGDDRFHVERVFAYELYYQWKDQLKKNDSKLMLNGEITKHYYVLEKHGFPDMVLHGGQNDDNNQFIIGEIKSSRNTIKDSNLKKDMESLRDGINILQFKCGVFIYLGDDSEIFISRLEHILDCFDNKVDGIILFVGINGREDEPNYVVLHI